MTWKIIQLEQCKLWNKEVDIRYIHNKNNSNKDWNKKV